MKSIGIVRKIDELGRIVLPIETRRQLGLDAKDGVEIFVDEDKIILKKYEPCCLFCGDGDNVVVFRDKKVCKKCLAEMQEKLYFYRIVCPHSGEYEQKKTAVAFHCCS